MTYEQLIKLPHPYPRYGYAVAHYDVRVRRTPGKVSEEEMRGLLIEAIENSLGYFRMRTANDPEIDSELKYSFITLDELRNDPSLIQSAGLSAKGMYLAPSIISTDGDAKGTFENAEAIILALKNGEPFTSKLNASRSFAPTTSKTNDGKASQSPPKITLFEAACSVITTLTRFKPSFLLIGDMQYTCVIPDLPVEHLVKFIDLFAEMQSKGIKEDLMVRVLKHKENRLEKEQSKTNLKTKEKDKKVTKKKTSYSRPRLHDGNYPYAPYDNTAFGAIGILAAMGKWAERTENRTKFELVARAISGDNESPPAPLYVISYDKISHQLISHHAAQLAIENRLNGIIASLQKETVLYSEMGQSGARYDSTNYKLFNMMAGRFLRLFNSSAFGDFLAFRAEYSATIKPLFDRYFMDNQNISKDIVESARAFGQWLNYAAWKTADEVYDEKTQERYTKVAKEKAKILAEIESTVNSSKNSLDMLSRVSIRAGRYLKSDAPVEAGVFMDAVAMGEPEGGISFENAKNLILAYSRLSTKREKSLSKDTLPDDTESMDTEQIETNN